MFRLFIALGVTAASVVSTAPHTAAPIPLPSATVARIRAEGQRAYEAARRRPWPAGPASPASAPARRMTPVPAGFTPRPPKPPRRG